MARPGGARQAARSACTLGTDRRFRRPGSREGPLCPGPTDSPRATRDRAAGDVPRPARILVRDFAIHPSEVRLDSGSRGRLTQAFAAEPAPERQCQAARGTALPATARLVEALQASGLPSCSGSSGISAGCTRSVTRRPGRSG